MQTVRVDLAERSYDIRIGTGTLPEAGPFLFFDAAPFFRPGEALDGFLARCLEAGVLLTPGPASGRDFESWVRLCFTAVPPDELRQALLQLGGVLGEKAGHRAPP